jgi:glycosyltransferase involved in cell wall biosynthesis
MRVLALEPYYDGSHRAFLDGWSNASRHEWTVLGLPARKWKWRMRHAAVTFADEVRAAQEEGAPWDVLFCSDMLNLAEFRGLAPAPVRDLPAVAYFHENQLTYPVRHEDERDYHYGLINMTTALSADAAWFNSSYHLDVFLEALQKMLGRMPDHRLPGVVERIRQRASVQPQGIRTQAPRGPRAAGPLRILWAARWEHDKDPETFFRALTVLEKRGVPFRLSVVGQSFRDAPEIFEQARQAFEERIDVFGHQPERADYEATLRTADVIVSTARHEFFGVSVAEAVGAGAWPLVPRRLAYPELLGHTDGFQTDGFFHDDAPETIASMLEELAGRAGNDGIWLGDPERGQRLVSRFAWEVLAPRLDELLEEIRGSSARDSMMRAEPEGDT